MAGVSRPTQGSTHGPSAELSRLFATERASMVRMATLVLGSVALAEEVVQDAFFEVNRRWDSLDHPGAYLRRTVLNGCAMALRRRAVEERYVRLEAGSATQELPSSLIELRDALARLSERQRVVVVLRYFVDITDEEIADALGVRPATVRSLARRAFAVLREELE